MTWLAVWYHDCVRYHGYHVVTSASYFETIWSPFYNFFIWLNKSQIILRKTLIWLSSVELMFKWTTTGKSYPDNKVHGATWGPLGSCRPQMGPVGPRWVPWWPHEPCYQGSYLGDQHAVCHRSFHRRRCGGFIHANMICASAFMALFKHVLCFARSNYPMMPMTPGRNLTAHIAHVYTYVLIGLPLRTVCTLASMPNPDNIIDSR